MTFDDFYQLPLLTGLFPLTFTTGDKKFNHLTIHCGDCQGPIPDDHTRGTVTSILGDGGYRVAVVDAYQIDAFGLCPDCKCLTRGAYIAHDDMTVTSLGNGPDETIRFHFQRYRTPTRWERIVDFLKRFT